jgi:hypothetical protein
VTVAEPQSSAHEVQRRLAAWRRTGDVHALWPDLSYAKRRRALERIRDCVSAMLQGSPQISSLDADDEVESRALGVAAFAAGLGPLLGYWIDQGQIGSSPAVREVFTRHAWHAKRRNALMRAHVVRIVSAMRDAGASPLILKGLHTGAEFFPHPWTRPASDIDIVVHPAERPQAAAALRQLAFVESRRTTYAARSEWTLTGSSSEVRSLEVDHEDNPWNVDLHTALERWYFRGTRRNLGDGAFASTRSLEIDGATVRVLDQPYLIAFLALHAGYEPGRIQMVRLLDVILTARADVRTRRLEWEKVQELLERTDSARFAYPAFALAASLAPGFIPSEVLDALALRATPRMRRVLASVERAGLGPLEHRRLEVKLMWARGGREHLMNVLDLLIPADDGIGRLRDIYARRAAALRSRLFGSKS